ncbi:hypothetical protein [Nocardia wallacei]|uniref:hypothetical protein n=1 Tax=Nocardia wallacei TaxID=480035 RepID=UPI002455C7CF|nr:hypothetical protein [Nocardia wallacei]
MSSIHRTEGTSPQPLVPDGTGHYHRSVTTPATPVWVRLDALCVRDPGAPRRTNGAGLDMTGERPGLLTHWVPAESGDWLARVSYSIPYADGRAPLHLSDQLVPAYAIRPRTNETAPSRRG